MEAHPRPQPANEVTSAFEVVVLVMSAGGLDALTRILRDLSRGFPAAIVVMQHLSGQGSALREILERQTGLSVSWIEDGDALEPGRVHVAPPGRRVEILPDRTCAVSKDRRRAVDPVLDDLLRSAADSLGARALAVVLTGMGRDGAKGALAVKRAGGIVIVQSEDTAEQPGMPRAAVAVGAASLIVPLQELGAIVGKVVRGAPLPRSNTELAAIAATFGGAGEIADFARDLRWAGHPLGPVHSWPQQLRDAVRLVVENPNPAQLLWGPDRLMFCNDAGLRTFGHPWRSVFARPCGDTSADLPETSRLRARVLAGERVRVEQMRLSCQRNGRAEDGWFDVGYTPVYGGEDTVIGVHAVWSERTRDVLAARRLQIVNRLASAPAARDLRAALEQMIALVGHGDDVPFACAYVLDVRHARADLAAAIGVPEGSALAPRQLAIAREAVWPVHEAIDAGRPLVLDDLQARFPGYAVDPSTLAPETATLHPLHDEADDSTFGVLILGTNPRLPLDDPYRQFLATVGETIGAKAAESHARHRERQRLERINELDRLKTEFFSNISHEFRTPLTLMLAPLEELQRRRGELPDPLGDEVALAVTNARRLFTLVDTLLDFSRIEAGRARTHLEPTDLASLTTDIAALFRSAADRAGLRYSVDCPPLRDRVWVDRSMWEKIVSNLLSNALKFTLEGEIAVQLREQHGHAELVVSDTGVGIPEAEQPHIFKRFHRVRSARARTHEGSGIGLALVHELVRLHHGRLRVRSTEGQGSTFTVWIALGKRLVDDAWLRDDREPRAPSQTAATLAREAERWDTPLAVPDGVIVDPLGDPTVPLATHAPGARILVVDDSVDMREYLRRLLAGRWRVDVAGDGEQALAMMRAHKPDLVVADVMMPNLDGFALLRAVRADEALRHTPVVLVTARAGEDAAIEGLMAGADDYIAKPFSARELVVRVGGQLELSRMRRRAGEVNAFLLRFSDAARGLPDAAAVAQIACRMILEQLGAERACWSEVDWAAGESVLTGACDASGGTVPDGRVPLDTREPLTAVHLEGRPVVVDDTQADPGVPAPAKKRFARSDVGAELVAPVMVDGTVRCTLAVQDRRPRRWTPEDIALVESVAGRCWTEVERTRAETRSDELERFSRVTVGRELRMIELKRQINRLQAQLGEPPQFPLGFDDEGDGHEHASAERLRRVMETEAVALLFFTSDGTLIDANDGFFRKTGYSRERVAEGRLHRRDMTPPEWVGVSEAQMQRLEETGRFGPYDKEYLRADGSRAWMRVSGRDLGDGTIVEIAIDIPRAS